jgi:hypothetical protein
MRRPKLVSREVDADAMITAPPEWGAGRVFDARCWNVAYKAGWGGSGQGRFLAGQMGAVDLGSGRWAAFAVMFHPSEQPDTDDPGKVQAYQVMEQALTTIKKALRKHLRACI